MNEDVIKDELFPESGANEAPEDAAEDKPAEISRSENDALPQSAETDEATDLAAESADRRPDPADSLTNSKKTVPSDVSSPDGARSRRSSPRRRAALLFAVVMCLCSVAAYICAGIFVADAIAGRGAALFSGELVAVGETERAAIEAIHSESADAQNDIPDETETDEKTAPAEPVTHPIAQASMACADPFALANETSYTPDAAALTSAEAFASATPEPTDASEPLVLVIHTHSTEAYLPEGTVEYSDDTSFRSADPRKNMIAVGDALCLALGKAGVRCLHCTEAFDEDSFIHSYEKSAAAVQKYISENPSIRYVLDVHRDAIFYPDGTLVAPKCADGAAQVMIVCGTDEMGADFANWRDNLAFAFSIQAAAKSAYPDLMRNVNLRGASFNEQLAERYLLVEIGSAGNTLAEAKLAAERFAEVFASVVVRGAEEQ